MRPFIFVGEKPSARALKMGVTWEDGRLAARTLFAALEACAIDPREQLYLNWFQARLNSHVRRRKIEKVLLKLSQEYDVIALGNTVSKALTSHGIPHRKLIHPAARGRIRKKECYQAHVRSILLG